MRYTLGIDPDVKDLAIGVWDDDGPRNAMVVHIIGKNESGEQSQIRMARHLRAASPMKMLGMAGPSIIAIEGQQIDSRKARPRDLFTLAHISGMAASWCVTHFNSRTHIVIPTPSEWKGGVAKHAHQARLYADLGWEYTIIGSGTSRYARPVMIPRNFNHITDGQWKHVGDALLLARWAHEQA